MSGNSLVGTWRLVSYHLQSADGQITRPWGHAVVGYLIYTEQGRVSVAFGRADRPPISADRWGGSDAEKAAAYDTYTSYAGTYELRGDTVVHHVEVSSYPNRVGTDLVRSVELSGDRLTLTTPPTLSFGQLQTGHLVWERV